jgi:hypothetical protein
MKEEPLHLLLGRTYTEIGWFTFSMARKLRQIPGPDSNLHPDL